MSSRLTGEVIHDPEIKDIRTFAVLLCLADDAAKETNSCSSSINEISRMAKCSRRTAIRVMVRLEEKGWIKVIRRTDAKGSSLPNLYTILKYGPPSVTVAPPLVTSYDTPSDTVTPPSVTQTLPSAKSSKTLVSEPHSPSVTGSFSPTPPLTPNKEKEEKEEQEKEEPFRLDLEPVTRKPQKQKPPMSKAELISELQKLYPKVDVASEYADASAWILMNPDRKFTQRFFAKWIKTASKSSVDHVLPMGKKRPINISDV